jgi:hypothetical protein
VVEVDPEVTVVPLAETPLKVTDELPELVIENV